MITTLRGIYGIDVVLIQSELLVLAKLPFQFPFQLTYLLQHKYDAMYHPPARKHFLSDID
jgi:hypothetical protein